MMRKVQTRCGRRQNFYHQVDHNSKVDENSIIRPPTTHPYSSFKNMRSQTQIRNKYVPSYFIEKNMLTNLKDEHNKTSKSSFMNSLPSSLKLFMNQLKIFLKHNCKDETNQEQFQQILKNLVKNVDDLCKRNKIMESILEKNKNSIKQLDLKILTLQQELKSKSSEYSQSVDKIYKKKHKNMEEMNLKLQNCRLTKLNEGYLVLLSEMENKKEDKVQNKNKNQELKKMHDTELLRSQNRISYLEMKLNNAEKVEAALTSERQTLKNEANQLHQMIEEKQEIVTTVKESMNQWRERALMQKEQSELNTSRQQFLLFSMKRLRQNNKNLIQKLLAQNKDSHSEKSALTNPNFQYEYDFFKTLPGMYRNSKKKEFKMNISDHKDQLGLQIEQSSFDMDYQNYKRTQKFDVSHMKMYRPTFFTFLQENVNPDIQNCRSKGNSSVSRIFIQVMRAISSSKLNQFIYSNCVQNYSRFPQFVYSWFQKYYFNSEKKCIEAMEPFMQKPYNQELFYRDLMNVKLDQSWEIITFREFLLEQLTLQELYFYLLCQMILFTKAGITKQTLFNGDFTILVEYNVAKSVLDIVLSDFQSWNITFLTSKLREKVIIRKKTEVIESGFFLRCLIQYYKIQRSNRYRFISKLFSQFENQKKGLRFTSFMTVMGKFTQVPMENKLQIYRDCYCLTKGAITPESIFIVCSENLVFLKYLKIRSFFRLPKVINKPVKYTGIGQLNKDEKKKKKQIICVQPSDPYLYKIFIELQKTIKNDGKLIKRIQSLGLTDINQKLITILRLFDDRGEIDTSILKCKHFLHFLSNCLQCIRTINYYNFYELLQEQNKKKTMNFWVDFDENQLGQIFSTEVLSLLNTYNEINNKKKMKDKLHELRIYHSAKKIQRFAKKKYLPSIRLFNEICDEIKKDKKQS